MNHDIERDPDKRVGSSRGTFDLEHDGVPADQRESGTAGLPGPEDVPTETVEALEQERSERLAADNRPDHAEVDNTGRTFDSEVGMFTDSEGYEEAGRRFPPEE